MQQINTDLNPNPQTIISRTNAAAQNVHARTPLSTGGSSCTVTPSCGSATRKAAIDDRADAMRELSPMVANSISPSL